MRNGVTGNPIIQLLYLQMSFSAQLLICIESEQIQILAEENGCHKNFLEKEILEKLTRRFIEILLYLKPFKGLRDKRQQQNRPHTPWKAPYMVLRVVSMKVHLV